MKPSVTIFYDYFSPAYKAGGPIRSLHNLVGLLEEEYSFSIVTGAYDKGDDQVLPGIRANEWNERENGTKVFYWSGGLARLMHVLKQCKGDTIYINGIYSPWFNILPLFLYKDKIVLAPRGMLHEGALHQKSLKKKFYLLFFKLLNWHRKVIFHATDEEEKEFIQKQFGNNIKVFVAPNVPENMGKLPILFKQPGNLKLVSVALVGPMKNYHLVLAALKKAEGNVTYNIYGPVVNRNYWNDCLNIIKDLPNNIQVNYHGELPPEKVKDILAENHVFILPSVSENFGHAIFESLSAAKPVITSNNTPWKNLQNFNAGWNTETTTNDIAVVINEAIALNNDQYSNMCNGAKAVADEYLNKADFSTAYKQLFG